MGDLVLFDDIKLFSGENFSLKYFRRGNEYLFKAINIAKELGYRNTREAVRNHVKDKYKVCFGGANRSPKNSTENRGGSNAIFVTLPGLFQFLATSNMPRAEPFQDWFFEEVLPSIIKTGKYKLNIEQKVESILEDINVENRPAARKMLLQACEQVKDERKSRDGKLGGQKCQENIRAIKKENVELKEENTRLKAENAEYKDRFRQTTLDLDYFRVFSKCLDP